MRISTLSPSVLQIMFKRRNAGLGDIRIAVEILCRAKQGMRVDAMKLRIAEESRDVQAPDIRGLTSNPVAIEWDCRMYRPCLRQLLQTSTSAGNRRGDLAAHCLTRPGELLLYLCM